MAWKMKFPLG
ncbi:unnamed protein product [Lathyrus oleraceus]